jgi:hypothetical protein
MDNLKKRFKTSKLMATSANLQDIYALPEVDLSFENV